MNEKLSSQLFIFEEKVRKLQNSIENKNLEILCLNLALTHLERETEELSKLHNIKIPKKERVSINLLAHLSPRAILPPFNFKEKVTFNSLQTVFSFLCPKSLLSIRVVNKNLNNFVIRYLKATSAEREQRVSAFQDFLHEEVKIREASIAKAKERIQFIEPRDLCEIKAWRAPPGLLLDVFDAAAYFLMPASQIERESKKNNNESSFRMLITNPSFLSNLTNFNVEMFLSNFNAFEDAFLKINPNLTRTVSRVTHYIYEFFEEIMNLFKNSKLLTEYKKTSYLRNLNNFYSKKEEKL